MIFSFQPVGVFLGCIDPTFTYAMPSFLHASFQAELLKQVEALATKLENFTDELAHCKAVFFVQLGNLVETGVFFFG